MMYAWGQFIDHDINLTNSDDVTHIDITVPSGDPTLSGSISMTRAVIDPATGTAGKPATATNNVTGWIDGSMVYGSDATTAASLRNAAGRMLTSEGNNLHRGRLVRGRRHPGRGESGSDRPADAVRP